MKDVLKILPYKTPLCASVVLPGSKSITNRAMLLAVLCNAQTRLKGALFSRDTLIMADCLKRLGVEIELDKENLEILINSKGMDKLASSANLFVGNAGTAARFITALVCLNKNGEYYFDSDEAMYSRPMSGLIDVLKAQGAEFEFLKQKNCFPFKVRTCGLKGGQILMDASMSSQLLSAMLMVSAFADKPAKISLVSSTVSKPFVDMTLAMMRSFGINLEEINGEYCVKTFSKEVKDFVYQIEPDASAASYFAMLSALVGGAVLFKGLALSTLQGDKEFINLLCKTSLITSQIVGEDLLLCGNQNTDLKNLDLDFNDISDTFLTLAAASAALGCDTKISGVAHTRKQETDRVSAAAKELKKICLSVSEAEDSISITAHKNLATALKDASKPIVINTYEDHRIAMSFGVLGSKDIFKNGEAWLGVFNPACCGKTWAEFFEVLEETRISSARFRSVAVDGGAAVGKSSVSKESAKSLGYMHVDTGSHYRTISYALLEAGVSVGDIDGIKNALSEISLSTSLVGNSARMAINSKLIDDALIRTELVNDNVSIFASLDFVREFLKTYQRSMVTYAKNQGFGGLIMEGRDIGSVILPNADVKIFLDADEETRLKRRANEGITDSISKRDAIDKARKTAPLVCPEGAYLIDTSHLGKDEVVALAISKICKS